MDVCPIPFRASQPLLPRFIPTSSDWTYGDPILDVVLTFGETMDTGVEPPPDAFVFDVDGTEKVPVTITWDDATHLSIEYSEAVLGPTVVRCRYSTKADDFVSAAGEEVTPFDILVTAP